MIRLLVCGGRTFGIVPLGTPRERLLVERARAQREEALLIGTLDRLHGDRRIAAVIQGKAAGADSLARAWAIRHGIPVQDYEVTHEEWKRLGGAAGPIRNTRMLESSAPDMGLAFKGGNGTLDMVRKMQRAGLMVMRVGFD